MLLSLNSSPATANTGNWQDILQAAEAALIAGRHNEVIRLCDRAVHGGTAARYRAALLRGQSLLLCGDPAGALNSYESIAHPDHADALVDLARGLALFELVQLPEAEAALCSALRQDPHLGEAYYIRALIAEMHGNPADNELWREARRHAPLLYPAALHRSRTAFEVLIDAAREQLSEVLFNAVMGMPLHICEAPHPHDLHRTSPVTSPHALSMLIAPEHGGPAILIFKRTIERTFRTNAEVLVALRDSVFTHLGERWIHSHA